jgi:parallel beta-helix repeat protein
MHDDTAALQAALDRAAEVGEGVVVLSPGVYRVSDPLVFRGDGCALFGAGQPTIAAGGLLTRILDSDGRSRLRIAGVSVQGAGVHERGGRGAVHLDGGSTGCTVENVEVVDAPGTGIVDDGDGNTVRGCAIERTGEHGVYVSGSRGGTYEGNRITGAGSVPGATLLAHGISVADAVGCTVRSNAVTGGSGPGIVLRDGSRGIRVTRNLVRDTGDRPLLIGSGSESLIAENVIEGAPAGRDALQLTGGGGNRIERNYVHQVGPGGAAIRWVSDEALGGDVVAGNVILLDGAAVNFWALALEAPRAAPIRIERNTIQAIRGAAPPAAIRVGVGRGHLLLDNLVLGVPELSDRGADTVARFRAARQVRRLGPGVHQVLAEDGVLRCDARSGTVTVVLPDAGACHWRVYSIVVANGAHPVVVRGSGGDRVAGTEALELRAGGALLQSTGGGWQEVRAGDREGIRP